ncbi:zf-HC2 domain-containing protein, partial [Streptomyces sp. SID9913]|nr:zf-HC2 domain-containing protein [Streptomyces sp. SID9913]
HETDRPASRGLRFAFVAAGAVSLAAVALGGVTSSMVPDAEVRGSGKGSNVTPARTQGTGAATAPESQRRRGPAPMIG